MARQDVPGPSPPRSARDVRPRTIHRAAARPVIRRVTGAILKSRLRSSALAESPCGQRSVVGMPLNMIKAQITRRGVTLGALSQTAASRSRPVSSTIRYNIGDSTPLETTFGFKVLKLALSKCDRRYDLEPSTIGRVTDPRAIEALRNHEGADLAVLGANRVADEQLLPVRIPIDRGLLGYRLLLIHRARQAEFARVRDLDDLRRFSALQGRGWADSTILRGAGLTVWTGPYPRLFEMMLAGRADFFPRSVGEIFGELERERPGHPDLRIEHTLALCYRFAPLFYVAPNNFALHDDIHAGLSRAFDDGSYDRLFHADPRIKAALSRAELGRRRVITLPNPFLSAQMRAIPERFWYRP